MLRSLSRDRVNPAHVGIMGDPLGKARQNHVLAVNEITPKKVDRAANVMSRI